MVLKFLFELESFQGIFERIALRIGRERGVKVGLVRNRQLLEIYLEGELEELEGFGKQLGEELPFSLFLRGSKVELGEEFKNSLPRVFPQLNLPPCPRCLKEVLTPDSPYYFNPFHSCEICGYSGVGEGWSSQLMPERGEFPELFRRLGEGLMERGELLIQTMNGKFKIKKGITGEGVVVGRGVGEVGSYFILEEGEQKGLASIEKPILLLKPTLKFRREFRSSAEVVPVKLPDDLVLELLFRSLPEGVSLLELEPTGETPDLEFKVAPPQPIPVAIGTDSRRLDPLLQQGERGILPALFPVNWEGGKKVGVAGPYRARYREIGGVKLVEVKRGGGVIEGGVEARPRFGGIFGVIEGWGISEKRLLCYSLWRGEGGLYLYSPATGLSPILEPKFRFTSFQEIFQQIRQINETGERLISNFRERLPELYHRALKGEVAGEGGLYYLWGVIGVLLGFGERWEKGANTLLSKVEGFIGKKGVRIDYRPSSTGGIDPLWVIRTSISYLLAGSDPVQIGYGVVESGAEYLSNLYLSLEKELELNGAVLVGNLLTGTFLRKLYSYLERNFPVYTPFGLPVTGWEATAVGG
ncbi:MAG: hypothetical protein ABGW77_00600, partial [Campylobacterales bacterium]